MQQQCGLNAQLQGPCAPFKQHDNTMQLIVFNPDLIATMTVTTHTTQSCGSRVFCAGHSVQPF